jgi:hypothetical protein
MQVNTNGIISFNSPVLNSTPEDFPLTNDLQLIAPYWADVDLGTSGVILYREASFNAALLLRAREDLVMASLSDENFDPTFLFIVTWDHVGYFGDFNDSNELVSIQ